MTVRLSLKFKNMVLCTRLENWHMTLGLCYGTTLLR